MNQLPSEECRNAGLKEGIDADLGRNEGNLRNTSKRGSSIGTASVKRVALGNNGRRYCPEIIGEEREDDAKRQGVWKLPNRYAPNALILKH
jgi:hypothetical protein